MQALLTILFIISTLICLMLSVIAWQRRDIPGALPFSIAMTLTAWFTFFSALQMIGQYESHITLWSKMKQPGLLFIPPLGLILALQYADRQRFVTVRNVAVLCIIPTISLILLVTGYNDLYIKAVVDHEELRFKTVSFVFGAWYQIYMVYAIIVILIAFRLLISKLKTSKYHQTNAILVVGFIAIAITVIVNISTYDTAITFIINALLIPLSGLGVGTAIMRFKLSDILPIQHHQVLQNMPNGFIILDSHKDIRGINPIMCNILSVSEKDLLNKPLDELKEFKEIVSPYLASGAKTEIVWKDRHYTLLVSGLPKSFLTSKGILIVLENITQQKQSQAKLQQQLTQMEIMHQLVEKTSNTQSIEDILQAALDATMKTCQAEYGFISLMETYVVKNRYPDIKLDQGIVKRVMDSKTPELICKAQDDPDYIPTVPTTIALMVFPIVLNEEAKGVINLETSQPTTFNESKFQFVQVLVDRITLTLDNVQLYKHIEEQYQEVSKLESLKTDMIRLAAHDLRNPLSVINGYATLIQMKKDLVDEKLQPIFDQIAASASRMQDILENFLSLERIESLKGDATHETYDIVRDVKRAVAEYLLQIPDDGQTLSLETSLDSVLIYGDRPQLYEAIHNLISNAVKYTPKEGKITVHLEQEDNHLIYKVVDNGFGVPEDMQESLFKPFSRIKTMETQEIVGIGLGLHLVKNIVNRAGGEIVFSSVYGEGSTFGFKLPIAKDPNETQELPPLDALMSDSTPESQS